MLKSICICLLLAAAACAGGRAQQGTNPAAAPRAGDYGAVGGINGGRALYKGAVPDDAPSPILCYQKARPFAYRVEVPDGDYTVRLHFLQYERDGEPANDGSVTVALEGAVVLEDLPVWEVSRDAPGKLMPLVREFHTTVDDGVLNIRFPVDRNRKHAINGIEVLARQEPVLRVNCGYGKPYTGPDGTEWQPDRNWRAPMDTEIVLEDREARGEWVEISGEIVRKLVDAGVGPVARYYINSAPRMGVVGMVSDRAGNTYVNVLGQGLWSYGGPGGAMRRVDQGRYTSMINARRQGNGNPRGYGQELFFQVVTNPNGPGFLPVSWCSFHQDASQICSPDGRLFFNFWQPRDSWDFGTCDWNAEEPRIFLICHHHSKGETWLSTDGGANFKIIFDDKSRLQALGVIGPNILLKALSREYKRGEFVKGPDDERLVGIHRSTDLGKTWQKVSDIEVTRGKGAIVYHKKSGRAFLNTQDGLAVSDDKGATWRVVEDSPFFFQPVWFGGEAGHLVGANPGGFYESRDGGETWRQAVAAPEDAPEGVTCFAWDAADDVFYAGEYNGLWYRYER